MITYIKSLVKTNLRTRVAYKFFIKNWLVPGDAQRAADVLSTMRHTKALDPVLLDGPAARRVVVIAPHPDDEIIGPGGALIRLLDRGTDVLVVYLTNGDNDPAAAKVRQDEANRVAGELGYRTLFLGFPVERIPLNAEAIRTFAEVVTKADPEALFLPFLLDDNDDHRRASEMLMVAIEGGHLSLNVDVWSYQVYTPLPGNVIVDISEQSQRKADAIRMFTSQMKNRDWAHFALGLNAFNLRLLHGTNRACYVEAFFVLPADEYARLCATYFGSDPARCYLTAYYGAGPRSEARPS